MSESEINFKISELESIADKLLKNESAKLTPLDLWFKKYALKKTEIEIEKLKNLLSQFKTNE